MATTFPNNQIIFHITHSSDWDKAQTLGSYRAASLETEGFIHCSTAEQLPLTQERFFKNKKGFLILHILIARLKAPLRYENLEGGEMLFPHLYGPLELHAVSQATAFVRGG